MQAGPPSLRVGTGNSVQTPQTPYQSQSPGQSSIPTPSRYYSAPGQAEPGTILHRHAPPTVSLHRFIAELAIKLNVALLIILISAVAHYWNFTPVVRFVSSSFAVLVSKKILEVISDQADDSIRGIIFTHGLPSRFSQMQKIREFLAEVVFQIYAVGMQLILGLVALFTGNFRLVQTFSVGSILTNILLALGFAIFIDGLQRSESSFNVTATQTASSLMTLACITLIIPAAYHATKSGPNPTDLSYDTLGGDHETIGTGDKSGLLAISRGTAVLLLVVYVAFTVFQLQTHALFFAPDVDDEGGDSDQEPEAEDDDVHDKPILDVRSSIFLLLASSIIATFCAYLLVLSVDDLTIAHRVPVQFIGMIVIPVILKLSDILALCADGKKPIVVIGLCLGGSIQIALLTVPLLVIMAWITGREFTMFFANFETIVLSVSVFLVNCLVIDGKTNYMEGVMLIVLYFVIALAAKVW